MKKIIALLFMSILVLFGCSSSSEGEQTELVVWNAGFKATDPNAQIPNEEMPFNKMIAQYEEDNPNIDVTVVNYDTEQLSQALTAANSSGEGPDVIVTWSGATTLAFNEYLLPLDDYFTEEEKAIYDTSPISHRNMDPEDDWLAVPIFDSATGMFYNTEIFAEVGIDPAEFTEWQDVIDAGTQIQEETDATAFCVYDQSAYNLTWASAEFLIDLIGPEGMSKIYTGEMPINSPEMVQAVEAWKEIIDLGLTNADWQSNPGTSDPFKNGDCAMMPSGTWSVADYEEMGDTVSVFQFPPITADAPYGDYMMAQPTMNVGVTSYTEHPEEAVDLVKAMTDPEFIAEEQGTSGEVATRLYNEMTSWIDESAGTAISFDSAVTAEAANEFYKLGAQALSGELGVQEFLDKVQELNTK